MKNVEVKTSFRIDGKGYDEGKRSMPDDVAKMAILEGWAVELKTKSKTGKK